MAQIKELLPVGSVVILKEGEKKLMVIGIMQMQPGIIKNKYFDYLCIPWPEGFMSKDQMYFTNHEDINKVISLGYSDKERSDFVETLCKLYGGQS